MKKLYFLLLTCCMVSLSFSQGTETFDNFAETGSSYADGTFTGQDGSTWTYVQARGDQSITGKSIMLGRNRTPQAEVYSGTIAGGVGTITFNYQQAFSTSVNLNVLVNGIVYGTVTSTDQTVQSSGTITVNQPGDVVIKFISVNNSDGQVTIDDVVWTGYTGSATPTIAVTSPSDNSTFPSGTASVDVEFTTANTNPGDQVNITVNSGTTNTNVTSPFSVSTTDGTSYSVLVELVDSGLNLLDSETVNFEVLFPCDLQIGTITTVCDAETSGTDTYTTSIDFTGGNTSQYTIDTGGIGTLGGDDPTSVAAGTLTITGVDEGTDFSISFTGDAANSSCSINRNISSPTCVSLTCASPGDIFITEIMQNPNAVSDTSGEYFEVYNSTGSAIDMLGWVISDLGSDSFTIGSSVVVPPNGYAVFGKNGDSGTNGGFTADYVFGSGMNLSNSDDEIIISCSGTVIDQVNYDGGTTFPDPTGASMEFTSSLIARLNNTDNDNGANWGEATIAFGAGDLGSPGTTNNFVLSTESFNASIVNVYPNPTNTGFVTISSQNGGSLEAKVFDILGKQVLEGKVENNQLNVSGLNAGMYMVKLTQNNASIIKKLIIK